MVSLKKHIIVRASVKDAFNWIQWAPNLIGVWPNLLKTVNYSQDENGLGLHETIYMMAGMQIPVASQDTLKIPFEKIVSKSTGLIHSQITWTFEEATVGTRLGFEANYTIPIKIIGRLTENIVVRLNESDSKILLSNLKTELEKLYKDRL